jgi:glutamate synthase (NADPH/NADH) small chain
MKYERKVSGYAPVTDRLKHYNEFLTILPQEELTKQGARCMDCGVPFCHTGCPLGNIIPDFNDLVYRQQWHEASQRLHATNNFPEFTGRVCPAPCEAACVLGINEDPVAIKQIEMTIADRAFDEGWVVPEPPAVRTGKRVAVVGSGPAGLAAAQQLNRAGHLVTLFERADRPGGLLMYGIPDFKLEKWRVWRRVEQMREEGVEFRCGVNVGVDVSTQSLTDEYDAIVLTGGATLGRDLPIPGRELKGVHYAMEFLPQQNKVVAGDTVPGQLMATGRHVVVIGGGDTGSDCVGTSNRHGAAAVTQFELLPQPPEEEDKPLVWPYWPIRLRTSSSHEEGCERDWAVTTKAFKDDGHGNVAALIGARVEWAKDEASGQMKMREVPGSEFEVRADLVLFAMGFTGPVASVLDIFGVARDARGNARAATEGAGSYATSSPKVFAAGDMRRGQSLVVWAIREGRQCARAVDEFLMGCSDLPR